jgi:threonine/homoserine/homoserine lactone efflux protein
MAIGGIVAFWAVSLLLVLTPGADWAYAIGAGLRNRTIVPAVSGLLVGYAVLTVVVAAGVAALVASSPMALTVLTVAGAAYLVWLGVTILVRPAGPASAAAESPGGWISQLARGVGISGLNPKALLLFLALLPQFTEPAAAWPVVAQIVVLGVVHTASCAVVYTGVGIGARQVLRSRPTATRAVSRLSGFAMTCIGVALVVEQLLGG